jgi:hypothetical protein
MRLWRRPGNASQDVQNASSDVEHGQVGMQTPTEMAAEDVDEDSVSDLTSEILKPSRPSNIFDLLLLLILLAIGTAGAYWAWHIAHSAELKAFQIAFDGVARSLNVDMTSKLRAKVRAVSQHGVRRCSRGLVVASSVTHRPLPTD